MPHHREHKIFIQIAGAANGFDFGDSAMFTQAKPLLVWPLNALAIYGPSNNEVVPGEIWVQRLFRTCSPGLVNVNKNELTRVGDNHSIVLLRFVDVKHSASSTRYRDGQRTP